MSLIKSPLFSFSKIGRYEDQCQENEERKYSRNLFLDAWFEIHPNRKVSQLAQSTIESSTFLPLKVELKRYDKEKNYGKILFCLK